MSSWSAIVGAPGTEKGRAARKLASLLQARGLRVAGFVQQDVLDANREPVGWDIVSVSAPEKVGILARTSSEPDLCGYAFQPAGFAFAKELASESADVVIVGGVGKLEAAQRGHWPVLAELIARADGPHVVACIRDNCLSTVALALPDPLDYVELPCDDAALSELAERLSTALAKR